MANCSKARNSPNCSNLKRLSKAKFPSAATAAGRRPVGRPALEPPHSLLVWQSIESESLLVWQSGRLPSGRTPPNGAEGTRKGVVVASPISLAGAEANFAGSAGFAGFPKTLHARGPTNI